MLCAGSTLESRSWVIEVPGVWASAASARSPLATSDKQIRLNGEIGGCPSYPSRNPKAQVESTVEKIELIRAVYFGVPQVTKIQMSS